MILIRLNLTVNGKETCDKHAITNAFNNYFVQFGTRLANKIKNTTDPSDICYAVS